MAFTFTVEDGTGLANANSYASVSTAVDYLSANIHATSFLNAVSAVQEKCLVRAAQLLDQFVDWYGSRATTVQALEWPREGVLGRDGVTYIEKTVVPVWLQQAVAEYARFLYDADRSSDPDSQNVKSLKADVVEIEFDKTDRRALIPSVVRQMVSRYGTVNGAGSPKVRRVA